MLLSIMLQMHLRAWWGDPTEFQWHFHIFNKENIYCPYFTKLVRTCGTPNKFIKLYSLFKCHHFRKAVNKTNPLINLLWLSVKNYIVQYHRKIQVQVAKINTLIKRGITTIKLKQIIGWILVGKHYKPQGTFGEIKFGLQRQIPPQ